MLKFIILKIHSFTEVLMWDLFSSILFYKLGGVFSKIPEVNSEKLKHHLKVLIGLGTDVLTLKIVPYFDILSNDIYASYRSKFLRIYNILKM